MTIREWTNLLESLIYTFGPLVGWWLVFFVVTGLLVGLAAFWFKMLQGFRRRW